MRSSYILALAMCIFAFISCPVQAQQANTIDQQWQKIGQEYKKGKIKSSKYLDLADSLALKDIANPRLKEYLKIYKELVWQNDTALLRRRRYYHFLISNAKVNGQSGKVLYYVEKFVKEPGTNDATHYRNVIKAQLFIAADDSRNAAAVFETDAVYYNNIPGAIANGTYKGDPQSDQFLLYQMAPVFFELKDSAGLFHLITLAGKTYNNVIKVKGLSLWDKEMCYAFLMATKCFGYRYQGKIDSAEMALKEIKAYAISPMDPGQTRQIIFKEKLLQYITGQLLDLYISVRNIDSAKLYQQIAEQQVGTSYVEDDVALLKSRSQIQALSGDYKRAFTTMENIFQKTDTLLKRKTVEIAENMYAQALAEDKHEEAEILSTEKRKLAIGATIGVILLLLTIALLYYYARLKERKARASIEGLNRATALQIAELEERNRIEQQLEKKKLGLELHDGLASQLAYLKMLSEKAILDFYKPGTEATLVKINELLSSAYEATRNKSHEWYNMSHIQEASSYATKINSIIENALPGEMFQKEIVIDDYHLNNLSLPTKIGLMYIIQESLTNILKHAKCDKIILLIYEEFGNLVYRVKDNGKGMELKSKYGLGLTSIKDRSAQLNAQLNISSGKSGTEIIVTIPLH